MSIIRNKLADSFTQIPSKIFTSELSHGAVRVYCYLATKPDNWKVYNSDIKKSVGIGSDKTIAKYFKELLGSGWLNRELIVNPNGSFSGGYIYELVESPNHQKVPIRTNSEYGENGDLSNTNLPTNNKKESNNNLPFDLFYSKFPKKVDGYKAEKKWNQLGDDLRQQAIDGIERFVLNKDIQYISSPLVYLNGRKWNDAYIAPVEKKQSLPGQDDALENWAAKNGHRAPSIGESYTAYRRYLENQLDITA